MFPLWSWLMVKAKKAKAVVKAALVGPAVDETGEPLKLVEVSIPLWQYPQVVAAAGRSGKALNLYLQDVITEAAVKSQQQAERAAVQQSVVGPTEPAPPATQARTRAEETQKVFNSRGELQAPVPPTVTPTQAERVVEALVAPPALTAEEAHPCMAFRSAIPAGFKGADVAGSCARRGGGPCYYNAGIAPNCRIYYAKPRGSLHVLGPR